MVDSPSFPLPATPTTYPSIGAYGGTTGGITCTLLELEPGRPPPPCHQAAVRHAWRPHRLPAPLLRRLVHALSAFAGCEGWPSRIHAVVPAEHRRPRASFDARAELLPWRHTSAIAGGSYPSRWNVARSSREMQRKRVGELRSSPVSSSRPAGQPPYAAHWRMCLHSRALSHCAPLVCLLLREDSDRQSCRDIRRPADGERHPLGRFLRVSHRLNPDCPSRRLTDPTPANAITVRRLSCRSPHRSCRARSRW